TIYLNHDSTLLVQGGARVERGVATGRGGCIYADRALIVMNPATSVGACRANIDGGGVAIVSTHTPGAYNALRGIDDNVAVTGSGGGASIDSARVCLFDAAGNTAALDGGAAYVTSSTATAWLGTFDVQESNIAGRDGGGVFVTGADTSLDAVSRLASNSAVGNGGGIRATGAATVFLDPGVAVVSNNAQGDGGGVHGDALVTINVGAIGSAGSIPTGEGSNGPCGIAMGPVTIDGNRAGFDASGTETSPDRDGGGIYVSAASLIGPNIALTNNVASDSGGGVAAYAGAAVELQQASFSTNAATHGDGGGLLVGDDLTTAALDGASFTSNTANAGGGGGAAFIGADATLDATSFTSNTAAAGGGLGLDAAATITATTMDLTSNTAVSGGGVFATAGSTLTMYTGTFTSNSADVGGGIAAVSGTVVLGDAPPLCPAGALCVKMSSNTADGVLGRGGAIALSGANARVEVRRTRIVGSLADQGAAIWMDRVDHTLYIHNSTVLNNHGNNGLVSAIAVQAGTLAMLDSTIAHNDIGIGLRPLVAATMHESLVIQNVIDITGLNLGASMTGDCNGVQLAATQAAIVGADNVATTMVTASVLAATGLPLNTAEIVDRCLTGFLPRDIRGFNRPVGPRYDRGAFEVQ